MTLTIRPVETQKDLKRFVQLPYNLYKNSPYWAPPLKQSERDFLLPKKNPLLSKCDYRLWIAEQQGKVVGRIGGIQIPTKRCKGEANKARFTRLEFVDNYEVAQQLLSTAEEWARERGCLQLHGPLGFANLDQQGLLVEGFDKPQSPASVYHHEYYHRYLEKLGYRKEIDWVELHIFIPEQLPDKAVRLAQAAVDRYGLTVRRFSKRSELVPLQEKIFSIFNNAFSGLFSFVELDAQDIQFYSKKYIPLLHPPMTRIICSKEKEPIGFMICMPNLTPALQKAKGRLFPWGWLHLKQAYKNNPEMDMYLTGALTEYQKMGVPALLMVELHRTSREMNIHVAETTGMIETNTPALGMWKNFDHEQKKRKRCYIKTL